MRRKRSGFLFPSYTSCCQTMISRDLFRFRVTSTVASDDAPDDLVRDFHAGDATFFFDLDDRRSPAKRLQRIR